ncbi:hypothetical protein Ppro_0797 [Pelobacter propionicus DSM 2379]|uniref:Ribbon-helix-helix protein CopG domain-containing protein n=2 Tax=Pelobacter propionicus TaxID=29543 RepID=A1AM57_PELPD|nr:hypothetical protein Ppro_0797 [Pelobacter propionicus DSM 2379]
MREGAGRQNGSGRGKTVVAAETPIRNKYNSDRPGKSGCFRSVGIVAARRAGCAAPSRRLRYEKGIHTMEQAQHARETSGRKSRRKGARKREQLHHMISLRINDPQKASLERLSLATSRSISDIMREAVTLWSKKHRRLCLE